MIGVTRYVGECVVCEMPPEDRQELEKWLLARRGALAIAKEFALTWREVKQHQNQCVPESTGRMDKANEQRRTP